MNMVERVARAIYDVCFIEGVTLSWEKTTQGSRDLHIEYARAAIEAMKSPTPGMLDAGRDYCDSTHNANVAYRAMIAAALQEPTR